MLLLDVVTQFPFPLGQATRAPVPAPPEPAPYTSNTALYVPSFGLLESDAHFASAPAVPPRFPSYVEEVTKTFLTGVIFVSVIVEDPDPLLLAKSLILLKVTVRIRVSFNAQLPPLKFTVSVAEEPEPLTLAIVGSVEHVPLIANAFD